VDKEVLVTTGQALIQMLDQTPVKPRVAMWVYNPDMDVWRLWILPDSKLTDKQAFYRILAELISKHRDQLQGLDISAIELKDEKHPALMGLRGFVRAEGLTSVHVSNNRFNDFYLPDGIILRMAL
jgi:hypothetical protein